jgi:hypothetical protein
MTDTEDGLELEWNTPNDLPFPMPIPVRVNDELRTVTFVDNKATLTGVAKGDVLVDPYMQVLRKLSTVPTCEERRAEEAANPHR